MLLSKLAILGIQFFSRFFFFLGGRLCRFTPTCSAYATQAFQTYGFFKASTLTVRRLLRCHPFCAGGSDPLPQNFSLGKVS